MLYNSYQLVGGNETWVVARADTNWAALKPTFITILATDLLLTKDSSKEDLEKTKYFGPLYFDLDSDEDLSAAIAGAKKLVAKLKSYTLEDSDIEIFLSGKKGLHILVSPSVFLEKRTSVAKLPAIYKELAFTLAVDTLDFAVYSARRGRMFRTCYNVRSNGNYKVQITPEELSTLTPENYSDYCKAPRPFPFSVPTFRAPFSLLYEQMAQKISKHKKAKNKPVDQHTLSRDRPIIMQLMQGQKLKPGVGFNEIALQLGLYAHEAKLSEDQLIEQCDGLVTSHVGDGTRYNTPTKRVAELRRMFNYLEDNASYEYSVFPIKKMLEDVPEGEDPDEGEGPNPVFIKNAAYYISSETGDKHIMEGVFENPVVLRDSESEQISCLTANFHLGQKKTAAPLERGDFTSSAGLHRAVSAFGTSFTGTDVHARSIYRHMIHETKAGGKTIYATEREGLDVLNMPFSDIAEAREPFVVWADVTGVRLPKSLEDKGLDVRFVGFPDPRGSVKTDLAKAPTFPVWAAEKDNRELLLSTIRCMLTCQDSVQVGKLLGWHVACFYSQLFRNVYHQFPLLHVNGAAGAGKTKMCSAFCKMYYWRGEAVLTSPSSSQFAISHLISGSASVPVIVDEYKVDAMGFTLHNLMKQLFRTSYNAGTVAKGGGNRTKESFQAVSSIKLTGPIVFIAEALETEVAVLERCVVSTLRKPAGLLSLRYTNKWKFFEPNSWTLSIVGQYLAANIARNYTVGKLKDEFAPILAEYEEKLLRQKSQETDTNNLNPRVVYNHAIAYYGLCKFKEAIKVMYPENAQEFDELMAPLEVGVFSKLEQIVAQTVAEYIKVLTVMSDMSRFSDHDNTRLVNKLDYEISNIGDKATLNVVTRLCYAKYQEYCRRIGVSPLFSSDGSFFHGLRDAHIFIKLGSGTTRLVQESMVLDYDELQKYKVVFSK